jgi:hypothetical protein
MPSFLPLRWSLKNFFGLDRLGTIIIPISASHIAEMTGKCLFLFQKGYIDER